MISMMRWGGLLALSLVINIHFLSQVNVSAPKIDFLVPEKLRISFKSLAAPKSVPVHVQSAPPSETPFVKVAQKNAPRKIPVVVKVNSPQVMPLIETTRHKAPAFSYSPPTIEPKLAVVVPTPRRIVKKHTAQPKPVPPVALKRLVKSDEPVRQKVTITSGKTSVANNKGQANATVIHKAHYRERTPPRYPRRAYELGQQGIVLLHALVSENGIARQLKIETSSGHRLLDRAALSAVKNWEFIPHSKNGQKVQSWVRVPVNFVIQ